VAIAIGVVLLGAAAGAGLAWMLTRRSGKAAVRVAGGALAGAVTAHFLLAPVVTGAWVTRQARTELLAIPVYRVLAQHEPRVFERLVAEYGLVVRDRSHGAVYTQVANAEISAVATRHIAHASDAALLALMHDMLGKLQVLRARSPEDCYRYLFPKAAGPADLARWFDRDAQQRTLALMADVIRSSAEHAVAIPPRERVEPLLAPLVNEMYAQFGENTALLSRAEEPGVDHATVCAVVTTLYEKVMGLPPADAAAVLRSMTQL
jgi:hypothetical protein